MRPNDVMPTLEAISAPRLSNYISYFGSSDPHDLYACYQWNNEVSTSFLPILHLIEIALRNAYHRELSLHFSLINTGTPSQSYDWYQYANLNAKSRQAIVDIQRRAHRPDDVISRLTFGFWSNLTDTPRIPWGVVLKKVFPGVTRNLANRPQQDWLYSRIKMVNDFRNRVSHWEPIWKLGELMPERRHRRGDPALVPTHPATCNPAESVARLQMLYSRMTSLLTNINSDIGSTYIDSYTHEHLDWICSEAGLQSFRRSNKRVVMSISKAKRELNRITRLKNIVTISNSKGIRARIHPL